MAIKSVEDARANLEQAIPLIPDRYKRGVENARWKEAAASDVAEKNFADAMQKVIQQKARKKGIERVSDEEWKEAAITKGATVIADRIAQSMDKYEKNFGAVYNKARAEFEKLPPRSTDWRANINNRLVKTVEAWKKAAGKI